MRIRTLAALAASAALAVGVPSAAVAKHTPCGKFKPRHTNCGKHKGRGKGHGKGGGKGHGKGGGKGHGKGGGG